MKMKLIFALILITALPVSAMHRVCSVAMKPSKTLYSRTLPQSCIPKRNFWPKEPDIDIHSKDFRFKTFALRSAITGLGTGVAADCLLHHNSTAGLIASALVGFSAAITVNAWHKYKKAEAKELQNQKTDAEKFKEEVACIMRMSKKNTELEKDKNSK